MSRTVNKQKEDVLITHAVQHAQIYTMNTLTHTMRYYIIALLNLFSPGGRTEECGGNSFMQLSGPCFLFYPAQLKHVATEESLL